MVTQKDPIDHFWTGGWDSTFQLLRLLLLEQCEVTPYYLIHTSRKSLRMELQAMRRIKDLLFKSFPKTRELLHPTSYFDVSDIAPDPEIEGAYNAIRKTQPIGIQTDWLARFLRQEGIMDMQRCNHLGDKTQKALQGMVIKDEATNIYRLDPGTAGKTEAILFANSCFPIFDLTKGDMAEIAKQNGWMELMQLTWFCHKPRGGKPCGRCNPCKDALNEGMAWRVPFSRRIIGRLLNKPKK